MVDSTLISSIIAMEIAALEKYSLTGCRICSEFGSEECDVLVDLARYRRTEAILRAAERHAGGFKPCEIDPSEPLDPVS
jgi:hypothetical protein